MKSSKKLAVALTALILSSIAMTGCNKEEDSDNSVVYHTTAAQQQDVALGENNDDNSVDNNDTESKVDKKEEVKETTPSVESMECKKGELAEQQGLQVTLEKIEQINTDNKEKIFIYAIFDIKNITDSDITVNRLEHFHVKPDGGEHKQQYMNSLTASVQASKILTEVKELDGQIVTSGNSTKGYMVFELPNATNSFDLTYYPFIYSETKENNIGFNYKMNVSDVPVHE